MPSRPNRLEISILLNRKEGSSTFYDEGDAGSIYCFTRVIGAYIYQACA